MAGNRALRTTILVAVLAAVAGLLLAVGGPTCAQDEVETIVPLPEPQAADQPKNVIVMISDGCGFNHMTAARFYEHGDQADPLYEAFPVAMAMRTCASGGSYDPAQAAEDFDYVSKGATDSAAAATAMATGQKTYSGAIGVDVERQPVENLVEAAEATGRATGVVSSVQFAHATPAGFVAHSEGRGSYEEIARQMIHDSAADVIMGAGHPDYDDAAQAIEGDRDYQYVGGEESWAAVNAGTAGGDADADGDADPWVLVDDLAEFEALYTGEAPDRVLGVPRVHSTLQQRRPGDAEADAYAVPFNEGVPDLATMAGGALNVLDNDPDGLFLMIEGGAVDWAAHSNQCGRMIEEQIDFNRAVAAVVEWVEANSNWDETLLIVTADHETGYLTGPEAGEACTAPVCLGQGAMPTVEWHSGGHTNSLVPFFARGAGARLFEQLPLGTDPLRGAYIDNTDIGRVIKAALQ
jgi:alkaline phosphatase